MKSEELLATLIKLSHVDNYFDEFEFAYILKVGQQMGIQDEVVETMIKNGRQLPLTIPANEEDRMTIIYYLLFLMKVDTIITDEEKELIHHYGFKLGFSTPMIQEFIAIMHEHRFKKLEPSKLLDVIRKYKN